MRQDGFRSIGLLLVLLLSGCAVTGLSLPARHQAYATQPANADVQQCRQWFDQLDLIVAAAGVRDVQDAPIRGFPYLRTNRHLASYRDELPTPAATQTWLMRLRRLDQTARRFELRNLPHDSYASNPSLFALADRNAAIARATLKAESCGQMLAAADRAIRDKLRLIRERAVVPDNYSTIQRIAGVYPVTRLFAAAGIRKWEADNTAAYGSEPDPTSTIAQYRFADAPPVSKYGGRPGFSFEYDALGIPQLSANLKQALLRRYVPEFEVEQRAIYDHLGQVQLVAAGRARVRTEQPVVYGRVAFTRHRSKSVVQLIYTVWFGQRPRQSAVDIYAGHLDGLIVRITLTRSGRPAVIDSIHPCGCYHIFFATDAARPKQVPAGVSRYEEWRYMPGALARPEANGPLVVRVQSATHYVTGAAYRGRAAPPGAAMINESTDKQRPLSLLDENELRSLPFAATASNLSHRSLYGRDGLISGTQRSERFLLWPMGISSAGAMRQWGHHATAFVGRRHFDDAHLIEQRFRFVDAFVAPD